MSWRHVKYDEGKKRLLQRCWQRAVFENVQTLWLCMATRKRIHFRTAVLWARLWCGSPSSALLVLEYAFSLKLSSFCSRLARGVGAVA